MDGADMSRALAEGRLLLDREGPVARITLNNPDRLNAMRLAMWQGLGDLAAELAASDARVVVLRGAGDRAFCAGADISEFPQVRATPEGVAAYNRTVARALEGLAALPMPVLAAIRGHCIGGGLEIAVRCDLRLASETAHIAFTPAKLGLAIGADEVAALARIAGPAAAAELLYTAQPVDAARAERWGLVNRRVPEDMLMDETDALARTIAANAPLTLRAVKAGLAAFARPGDAAAASHADALVKTCYDSADYREGQRAFAEKRRPEFKGQ
ncbi:enoyl-CoA hydratase [Dinoroseobacter sp. PD6]|uniref:enoyl-CoA hydratase n=1 Tax=Dinoroseobacter sp. PD6 TaxID=3028384 RepID=UPI00237C0BB9|nr:enoyl-CoA hydratase [Dinoroseobacter sp. PD6]MDD9715890.1 enoyl-CoA hydratase [Dinoroseobacter sp. PD6]